MPSDHRLIDDFHPEPRSVDMEILVLGMSRTGTMSLWKALHNLGYKTYHMVEAAPAKPRVMHYWQEALEGKYHGKGKPYGPAEFDKLLGKYSAISDIPCILFADELLEAYPNAKVILTVRDVDRWIESMNKTFYYWLNWWSHRFIAPFDIHGFGPYIYNLREAVEIWTKRDFHNRQKLRQGYLDHNDHIRAVVPKENLLEFRAEDGWGPLCEFLGKPVPDEPYPRINETSIARQNNKYLWIVLSYNVLCRFAVPLVATAVGIGGVYWATRK